MATLSDSYSWAGELLWMYTSAHERMNRCLCGRLCLCGVCVSVCVCLVNEWTFPLTWWLNIPIKCPCIAHTQSRRTEQDHAVCVCRRQAEFGAKEVSVLGLGAWNTVKHCTNPNTHTPFIHLPVFIPDNKIRWPYLPFFPETSCPVFRVITYVIQVFTLQ